MSKAIVGVAIDLGPANQLNSLDHARSAETWRDARPGHVIRQRPLDLLGSLVARAGPPILHGTASGLYRSGVKESRRAAPMAPSERRAAIVEAIVPLVCARGWSVTTKEIAAAAGVADGTIFSVFKDKEELLLAALQAALDPEPVVEQLSQIDLSLPLEERLLQAVNILQELVARIGQLSPTLALDEVRGRLPRHYSGDSFARQVLAPIFEPSRHELRLEPAVAGQALFALTGASNPVFYRRPLKPSEIVAMMLDGVRAPAGAASAKSRRSRKV